MTALEIQARSLLRLELTARQIRQFSSLSDLLLQWNERLNLTSITDPDAIVIQHFLDSLTLLKVIDADDAPRLMDVGAGAGFPGLPLAIALPQTEVTLLESRAKKLKFIEAAGQALELDNIRTVHARAEDAGQSSAHRQGYDVVAARAVAAMPSLLEYLLPLAKVGGRAIAMLGSRAREDVERSRKAMTLLGGELHAIEPIMLPTLEQPRHLVVVHKARPTPKRYPRQAGMPTREPLA